MGNGTSIGRVRGLGSAHSGAHHWLVQRFTASISFDRRLAMHDIAGSLAHARMLALARELRSKGFMKIVSLAAEVV